MVSKRTEQQRRKTKGVVDDLLAEIKKEILILFRTDVAPLIKQACMDVYDDIASQAAAREGPAIKGKDPLSLVNVRHLFEAQIDRELADIRFEGEELVLTVVNEKTLGFGESESREGPPVVADMLHFYIQGMAGDFAFITPEQKAKKSPSTRKTPRNMGRVGGGFMISKQDYIKERWELITKQPFEAVRHPVSGFKRTDAFDKAIKKVKVSSHIKRAAAKATKKIGIK